MIDEELYARKMEKLSDDRLKELLSLRTKENAGIMSVAEREAIKRGIDLQTISAHKKSDDAKVKPKQNEDINWTDVLAAFFS